MGTNPTITLEFPAEAASKIGTFKSTAGEAEWDNILRGFDSVLGCLPVAIATANVPGNITLPVKLHSKV